MSFLNKVYKGVSESFGYREKHNRRIRELLNPYEFTVFSNTCVGGVFLHDAGKRFNSPLINMRIEAESFLRYLEDPRAYSQGQFTLVECPELDYPVGICKDIKVFFVHYKTLAEATEKWIKRSERIIWDKIYIIASGHGGLESEEYMERFDRLKYANKIMFTSKEWPQYSWAKQVKILHEIDHMPPLTEIATITGLRYYETAFDLADWISNNQKSDMKSKRYYVMD